MSTRGTRRTVIYQRLPKNFLQYALEVRQRVSIVEVNQSLVSSLLVNLFLGLCKNLWVKEESKQKHFQNGAGLSECQWRS